MYIGKECGVRGASSEFYGMLGVDEFVKSNY